MKAQRDHVHAVNCWSIQTCTKIFPHLIPTVKQIPLSLSLSP